VSTLDLVLGGAPATLAERFEVGYVEIEGRHRLPPSQA
jgi:hypothetical protein